MSGIFGLPKTLLSRILSGGSIDNAAIGATTPSTGKFTTLTNTGGAVCSANFSVAAAVKQSTNVSVANGANVALPSFTAAVLELRENSSSGEMAQIRFNNGTVTIMWQDGSIYVASASPAAGKVGFAYDAGSSLFRLYNNAGASRNFSGVLRIIV